MTRVETDDLHTPAQAAKLIGINRSATYKAIEVGRLAVVWIGDRQYVTRREIERFKALGVRQRRQ